MDRQEMLFDRPSPSPPIADSPAPARHSHPETSSRYAPAGERRVARKLQATLAVYLHTGKTSAELAVARSVDRVEMARWLPDARRDGLVNNGPDPVRPIKRPCTAAKRRQDGSRPVAICWFPTAAGIAALKRKRLIQRDV